MTASNQGVMLTRLEITHSGELYAGFRNLGGIFFPGWKHLFPTGVLGRYFEPESMDLVQDLERRIQSNAQIKNFKQRLKNKYWNIYQIFCPINLKDNLPKEFVRGHYTQQARWRLSPPGSLITLNSKTQEALARKKQAQERLLSLLSRLSEGRNLWTTTRVLNDLNDLFEGYNGQNFDEITGKVENIASLRNLGLPLLKVRKELSDFIDSSNAGFKNSNLRYVQQSQISRARNLKVEQKDFSYLANGKIISGEKLWNSKWMFLDIEIPWFKRENPKITWVGVQFVENGRITKSQIYTVHDLGFKEVKGFEIIGAKSEKDLIIKLAQNINQENPEVASSYNTRFDFIKLRENEAGFPIGEDQTDPLLKVTTKFFERIGIKDRLVIDPLRWAKNARAYDPNAKLEMVAGFEKVITYNEMDKLEENLEGRRVIAGYLADDMQNLTNLFLSNEFRQGLEITSRLSEMYDVSPERLLHSTNCINDAQEREYVAELGTYRENIPPHFRTKKMQQRKSRSRERLRKTLVEKLVSPGEILGLSQNVHKVFVPVGDFFKELIARRFPQIEKIDHYKQQFKSDKKSLFFLSRYELEFSRWLREDYGNFVGEVSKFDKLTEGLNLNEFEDVYHLFRDHLNQNHPIGLDHLDEAAISSRRVSQNSIPELETFLRKHFLGYDEFADIINQRSKVKRVGRYILGNYDVFPTRRFFEPEKKRSPRDILVIEEIVQREFDKVNNFLRENKLNVVAREGDYLYLRGDKNLLESTEAPVILVDEIPNLYNADKPYYEKHGYLAHMKDKEEPDFHLNLMEMRVYSEMLRNLLQGKNDQALITYDFTLTKLRNNEFHINDLIFFNKTNCRYSIYSEDSENENGRLYFVTSPKFLLGTGILQDIFGSYSLMQEGKKQVKVYVVDMNSVKPDLNKYAERFMERAGAILSPVLKSRGNKGQLELALR